MQDDGHIFCLEDQIKDEIRGVLDLTEDILLQFGFSKYEVNLSTRPDKAVGDDNIWERATSALRDALNDKGWNYQIDEGGGAFYGPKIDLKIEDALGRKWQCSTIQASFEVNLSKNFIWACVGIGHHFWAWIILCFNLYIFVMYLVCIKCTSVVYFSEIGMLLSRGVIWLVHQSQVDLNLPQRFDITYVDSHSEKKRPIMIHRAVLGSLERFFGVLIEHYAGDFPLWLSPIQARVLPVTDTQVNTIYIWH